MERGWRRVEQRMDGAPLCSSRLLEGAIAFGQMFLDVHRELHRVNVMGNVVAIELSIQGTFRGPMETPAGVIQPTRAKVNIPCADFFYLRNGKIRAIRLLPCAQHHA